MNILRWLLFFAVFPGLNIAGSAQSYAAETIQNMYEARVPLSDRSTDARRAAMLKGLEQVLVRYTGYSGIGKLGEVAGALANAERYAIEFAVETQQVPAADGLTTERAEVLWVRYNASQIDDLVDRQQLPIWSSLRPSVKYLMVQDLWDEPALMKPENLPALEATLQRLFYERGMSATHMASSSLSAREVWQLSEVDAYKLFNESEADLLLLVRVLNTEDRSSAAEVMVVEESQLAVFRQRTGSAISDLSSAINDFVDSYSTNYAFLGGGGQVSDLFISVLGMDDFTEYRRFLDLISGIEQVSTARLEAFRDDQMLFRIAYGSNRERLLAAIKQQTKLTEIGALSDPLASRERPMVLAEADYQWGENLKPIFSPPQVVEPQVPVSNLPPAGQFLGN